MAQKLKFGNGTWATKEGSTLAYNDENNNFKPLPFTTTRDSIATRVNKEGLIEVVGNNIPRIDYTDSADGVLLLENSSTNLVTYSEDFSNSVWNTGSTRSVTFVPTNTIDPQGNTNAYRVTSTASDNQVAYLASIVSGQSYVNSIYVRRISGNGNIVLRNVNNGKANFQVSVNDGWKRIDTSVTSTSTNGRLYVSLVTIGDVIEIWGAQLEQGSYPTSYIPTSGSTVTRQADTANGAGNSEVFNDSEGVLFVDIAALATAPTRGITLGDGTSANRVQFFYNSSNVLKANVINVGSQVTGFAYNGDANLFNKCALKYKVNDFAFWVNGFKIAVDTNGITPVGLNRLNFDNGVGTADFYGKTKEIAYYDTALTDAELETLTSYRSLNELVTELNLNTL